jgi:aminomethyltransferase
LYLRDGSRGGDLWDAIMAAGEPFGLKPGHTSSIRRIEGGMLSYHADMDLGTNPFELGMDRLVDLEMEADFIGKDALRAIKAAGVTRRQVGLSIDGAEHDVLAGHAAWRDRREGDVGGSFAPAGAQYRAGDGFG